MATGGGGGGSTVTVTVCPALPLAPEQVSVKSVVAVNTPLDWLPLIPLLPLQPATAGFAEAVQPVALVVLQLSVDEASLSIMVGLALSVTVGVPDGPTVTLTVWPALPPAPEQVSVKLVVAVNAPLDWLPLIPTLPLQPATAGFAEAVQSVALVALQLSVDEAPLVIVVGFALKVTVGGGGNTVTVTVCPVLPLAPEQVSVKSVVAVNAPLDWFPLIPTLPLQPTTAGFAEAVQPVALVVLQVSVDEPPVVILVGLTLSVTVSVPGGGDGGDPPALVASCSVPSEPTSEAPQPTIAPTSAANKNAARQRCTMFLRCVASAIPALSASVRPCIAASDILAVMLPATH